MIIKQGTTGKLVSCLILNIGQCTCALWKCVMIGIHIEYNSGNEDGIHC